MVAQNSRDVVFNLKLELDKGNASLVSSLRKDIEALNKTMGQRAGGAGAGGTSDFGKGMREAARAEKEALKASQATDKERQRLHDRHRQRQLKQARANRSLRQQAERDVAAQIKNAQALRDKVEASNQAMIGGARQALEGTLALARGFVLLGVTSERDLEKVVRTLAKFQGFADVAKGTTDVVIGLSQAYRSYSIAVQGAAAGEKALAASRAVSGAASGAASVAGVGAAGAGAAAALPVALAVGAGLGALALTVAAVNEDFRNSALDFIGWTDRAGDAAKRHAQRLDNIRVGSQREASRQRILGEGSSQARSIQNERDDVLDQIFGVKPGSREAAQNKVNRAAARVQAADRAASAFGEQEESRRQVLINAKNAASRDVAFFRGNISALTARPTAVPSRFGVDSRDFDTSTADRRAAASRFGTVEEQLVAQRKAERRVRKFDTALGQFSGGIGEREKSVKDETLAAREELRNASRERIAVERKIAEEGIRGIEKRLEKEKESLRTAKQRAETLLQADNAAFAQFGRQGLNPLERNNQVKALRAVIDDPTTATRKQLGAAQQFGGRIGGIATQEFTKRGRADVSKADPVVAAFLAAEARKDTDAISTRSAAVNKLEESKKELEANGERIALELLTEFNKILIDVENRVAARTKEKIEEQAARNRDEQENLGAQEGA